MPGITISAGYGAGGSQVAPSVADRLGWQFLDRAISSAVAERLHLPVEEVETGGPPHSRLSRFLATLAPLALQTIDPVQALEDPAVDEADIRRTAEELMRSTVHNGGAVVLGRGGMCALLHEPDVLRVRLYGEREARIRQAMVVEDVPIETARRRVDQVDQARDAYLKRLYGRSPDDPSLFDLQIDSTRLPLPACVELIVTAFQHLVAPA